MTPSQAGKGFKYAHSNESPSEGWPFGQDP